MSCDLEASLAESIADYLATRTTPWPDEPQMREAVRLAVRLMFGEAREQTRRVLDAHEHGRPV